MAVAPLEGYRQVMALLCVSPDPVTRERPARGASPFPDGRGTATGSRP